MIDAIDMQRSGTNVRLAQHQNCSLIIFLINYNMQHKLSFQNKTSFSDDL